MRERDVAAALIRNEGTFFMQKGVLGLIGFWSGEILEEESAAQAASRQTGEKTNLSCTPYDFTHGDILKIPETYKRFRYIKTGGLMIAYVYKLNIPEGTEVEAREGTSMPMDPIGLSTALEEGELSPIAEMYFKNNPRELINN
jgi:ADP-ribose pyrophosphatase YjhB (NUDIX family)